MMISMQPDVWHVIDIGNTRIHCGVVNIAESILLFRRDFPAGELTSHIVAALHDCVEQTGIPLQKPVIVAGGTDTMYSHLCTVLNSASITTIRFGHSPQMPFTVVYDSTPGADRIADALYSTLEFPDHDKMIIGAGTAITMSIVINNQFRGGVILPGITTQLKSLHASAPALPLVDKNGPIPIPGHSTETGIRSGVLYGSAGAIERIISEYRAAFSKDFLILASGGDWPYLCQFFNFPIFYNPDMTLIGVALGCKFIDL